MEVSEVRRRVAETIDRARHAAADRRARTDEASRAYAAFLDEVAVPLMRQIANILKAEGYAFSVFTPGGGVRLMSDKSADDFIELSLDTSGAEPSVTAHVRRTRGRRVIDAERAIHSGPVAAISEGQLLDVLLRELEPFVEK
jgi:DNA-binding transcriptional ArsR family regulator